jgi:hypothetical protein
MSKIENIKSHLKNNKVTYIACGVTAVVVAGVTYYVTRNGEVSTKAVAATTEFFGDTVANNAPQQIRCYKPTMNNIVNFVENSTPSKRVGLLSPDGAIVRAFNSIGDAARSTGLDKGQISKNVNELIDSVGGQKFVLLEEFTGAAA